MRNGIILPTAAVLGFAVSASAATLTVDLNGGADYTDIQSAIDAAADGDTVLVMPGEYVITEPIDFNRLHDPEDPLSPPVKNIVVRSEGGAEVTKIRMGEPIDPERASVVVFENGESGESTLEGVTLTGGEGTLDDFDDYRAGGGILCVRSSPAIVDCTISYNSAVYGGGVVCYSHSSPILRGCTISYNMGRGVWCGEESSPVISSCTISGNFVDIAWSGGGVLCDSHSSPLITSCTISGNEAMEGGGVCCNDASPTLVNCTITGNVGDVGCGGVLCYSGSSPVVITNCTISGNWGGGMHCSKDAFPIVQNCIVWNNIPESICGDLSQCLTDQDPLFVDAGIFAFGRYATVTIGENEFSLPDFIVEEPDFHLRAGSPAIDAGRAEGAPTTDIEGNIRPCWNGIDIGAYEYCGDEEPVPLTQFRRGDANASGRVDIADAISLLSYLFGPADDPSKAKVAECVDAADANDDATTDIADAIKILGHLFAAEGPLPGPFGECGIDLTVDGLDCLSFAPCEGL